MEVEAARNGVDVEAFAQKKQSRFFAALHCGKIDPAAVDAAARNKLALARGTPRYAEFEIAQ